MAVEHFYDALVLFGAYDLSGDHNEITLERKSDMLDVTTFGNATRKFLAGLDETSLSGSGFADFDGSTTPAGVDENLNAEIGAQAKVASLAPSTDDGEIAYVWQAGVSVYSPQITVSEAGKFEIEMKSAGRIGRGFLVLPLSTRSAASGNGTVTDVGALAAGETLAANLHVTEFDGTSLDVTLRSNDTQDTDTPTSRGTFAQATGVTSEQITVAGAVTDQYWYVDWSFTGTSFKAAVAVGVY